MMSLKISFQLLVCMVTCFFWTASAHAVSTVSFSGTISNFNPGPFVGSTSFSGSFTLDDSIAPTGGGIKTFTGVVDNFALTVGGDVFTGQNGRVQQFIGAGPTEFVSIALGGANGTLGGITGTGFAAKTINFDLRGTDLFADTATLFNDLIFSDFSFRGVSMRFDDTATEIVENDLSKLFLSDLTVSGGAAGDVLEPGTLALIATGLAGLGLFRRRRTA